MAIGDVRAVDDCTDVHYVDTGMYDVAAYGSVYVVDADRPAVVDAGIGADRERVFDALDAVGVAPEDLAAVVLTHVHLDHAGGAGYLAERCPEATVYAHERGVPHLADPSRLVAGTKDAVGDAWRFYADPVPVPESRLEALTDGDAVDLGDRTLTAHGAPGHAPHQLVFRDDRDGAVFTGDAAGIWVPSREAVVPTTPPPQFDLDQCLADVETIRDLDPSALLYAHFGPGPDDVDAVLTEYRRTLEAWVEEVAALREELGDDEAVVARAADETDLDDAWGERKARQEAALNARGALRSLAD
jgi:glyoxylase-like metal-dependent hydrolase (beta-lactamase superfamily II)